jgi:hypothetical protein
MYSGSRTRIIIPIFAEKIQDAGISVQDPILKKMLESDEETKIFQMSVFLDQIEVFHEVMFEEVGDRYTMLVLDPPGFSIITPLDFETVNQMYNNAVLIEESNSLDLDDIEDIEK